MHAKEKENNKKKADCRSVIAGGNGGAFSHPAEPGYEPR